MATTIALFMGTLIDEVLDQLYRLAERPFSTTVGANALTIDPSDVTFTLTDGSNFNVSDVVEMGSELIQITAKTTDAIPVFTGSRGYLGTALAAHVAGVAVLKGVEWNRARVQRQIQRFFEGPGNTYIPSITSESLQRTENMQYISLASTVVKVLSVRHFNTLTGRVVDIGGWQFEEDLPADIAGGSGKLLRVPTILSDEDEVIVTYQQAYAWSDIFPTEASFISVPLGSGDLPVLYAAAYLVTRREVTRMELDTIEEWNQEQATRLGVNLRQVQALWGEFYRRIDEVRKLQHVPRHRVFRKMPHI